MNQIIEFNSELKIDKFLSEITEIDEKDSNFYEKMKLIYLDYIDYIYSIIKTSPLEKVVAIIDYFNNIDATISAFLLLKNDNKIIKASLLLEKFNGIDLQEIKYNLDEVLLRSYLQKFNSSSKSYAKLNSKERITKSKYIILQNYLKEKDDKEIESIIYTGLKEFANGLHNVDSILFSYSSDNLKREKIINSIFLESKLDISTLETIFNDVLQKNKYLKSFDYCQILISEDLLICKIRGLFRKCSNEFFSFFGKLELTEEYFEACNNMFKQILQLNNDDEVGLIWFFNQVDDNASEKFKNYLNQFDYYKEINQKKLDRIYDVAISKLLSCDKNIDSIILESLGSYKGFLDKYDVFLDAFYNSNDEEYQKKLLLPLIIGLAKIQKEKYNLNFNIEHTMKILNNNVFGYYCKEEEKMYISSYLFEQFSNNREAFTKAVNTVFHETKHAMQIRMVETCGELNYNNLLMAMDLLLYTDDSSGYYKANYNDISFEQDARDYAYTEATRFFANREEYQKYLGNQRKQANIFSKLFIRKDFFSKPIGIINYFIKYYNDLLDISKDDIQLVNYIFEELEKYPVIKEFFDLDREKITISPKSSEYLLTKKQELEKMNDKTGAHSIIMFNYALHVGKCIEETEFERAVKKINYDDIERFIMEHVGIIPFLDINNDAQSYIRRSSE